MLDMIEAAAALERQGRRVILYSASNDTINVLGELERRFSVRPAAICDSDKNKWGKQLLGIAVLSPDEALAQYPDAYFYVISSNFKYQIMASLLYEYQVPQERIVNYEPMERRKSCMYLEYNAQCNGQGFCFCSSDFGKNQSPRSPFDGDYHRAVEDFLALRDKLISDLNSGNPTPCDGCPCVKEDWYAAERKVRILNFAEGGLCNCDCCYCISPARTRKSLDEGDIHLDRMLAALRDRELLPPDFHLDLDCGEITVHPWRKEIYPALKGLQSVLSMTNALVYDEALSEGIAAGNVNFCVSVDAGTPETFAKVKNRNAFLRVRDHLLRYAAQREGAVGLKFIFVPGLNDNEADVDGFVALCRQVRPGIVLISYDLFTPNQTLTRHTFEMVRRMMAGLDETGAIWKNLSDVIDRAFLGDIIE